MRPVPLAALCSLVAALGVSPARAEGPAPADPAWKPRFVRVNATLEFQRGKGAEGCPKAEEYLRREVGRRMGYDPFGGAEGRPIGRVRVVLSRAPRGFAAVFAYVDASGALRWERTYPVDGADASACELAMSGVAIELMQDLRIRDDSPPPVSAPVAPLPAPPPEAAVSTPDPAPPAAPHDRPLHLRYEVGLGVFAGAGLASRITGGGALHAGIAIAPFGHDRARLSFAFEGSVTAPVVADSGVQTQLYAGSILACGEVDLLSRPIVTWGLFACGEGLLGVLRGTWSSIDDLSSRSSTHAALGARLGGQARFGNTFSVRLQGDLLPALHRARVLRPASADGSGPVAATLGLAAVLSL
ncbi:MAG: hypothetical protein QM820_04205 [Minicystis sp.]